MSTPTTLKDYAMALLAAGEQRFSDELRECRTLTLIVEDGRRVKVDIPEDLIMEDRRRRWKYMRDARTEKP